jgi:hypothetical protein
MTQEVYDLLRVFVDGRHDIVVEDDLVEAAEKLELRRAPKTNADQQAQTKEIGRKLVTSSNRSS